MKILQLLMLTGALAGACHAQMAGAVPKAAEHEDAPVTHGAAESPRPRPGARALEAATAKPAAPVRRKIAPHERAAPSKGKPVRKDSQRKARSAGK